MKRFLPFALLLLPVLGLAPTRADLIKQSAAYQRTVLMTSSSDHVTGATGLTLTVTLSKAGAAYAAITPTVTELGNGVYSVALATGNTGTLGGLDMHVTATGADPADTHDQVVAFDPTDASLLGLTGVATATGQTANSGNVTAIKAKTDLIATNAGDSPNAVAAQAGTASNGAAIAALPAADATAVWGASVKAITANGDKTGYSLSGTQAFNNTGQTTPPAWLGVSSVLLTPEQTKLASASTAQQTGSGGTAQTGDLYALVSPLVSAGKFTAPALSLGPVSAGSTGDTPGVTTMLANYARRSDPMQVGSYAAGQDPATLLFASLYITIPGSHTTSGVSVSLTYKQWMALTDALPGGDNTSTAPVKSGTASTTYYLRGQPKTSATLVAVSTVTYDANGNQVSRTVLTAQPFPAVN